MLVGSSRETSWPRVSSVQLVVVVSVIAVCLAAFAVPATGAETEGWCAEAVLREICEEERAELQQEEPQRQKEQEAAARRREQREAREKREAEHRNILYVYKTRPNLAEVVLHVDAAPGAAVEVSVRADGHRIRQWSAEMPGQSGHGNDARQRTFAIYSLCRPRHPYVQYRFSVLDYGESGEKTRNGVFRGPHRAACLRRARANQRRREAAARRMREREHEETSGPSSLNAARIVEQKLRETPVPSQTNGEGITGANIKCSGVTETRYECIFKRGMTAVTIANGCVAGYSGTARVLYRREGAEVHLHYGRDPCTS